MHRLTARFVVALFALAVPTVGQFDEAATYFSLSTERTFASSEKPKVRLWGRGFDRLEFRVYRINDALEFFKQLDDPNNFGGRPPRQPQQLTLLEKFHQWKLASRSRMRNVVRQQFTATSRESIRETLAKREQRPVAKASTPQKYADVPVLNQQQVVAVWEQPHATKNSWESQFIPIDVKERGVYLVEATDGKLQAYTIVCITDLVMITKTAEGAVLARVVDRRSGQAIAGTSVYAWSSKQEIARTESDKNGFFELRPKGSVTDNALLLAHRGADFAPAIASGWSLRQGADAQTLTAYVYTDRPVYRPSHQVHFRAVVRARKATQFALPAAEELQLEIDDPEGNPVLRRKLTPGAIGTISGELTLSPSAPLGYYGISLRKGEQYTGSGGFHVEEYRKPEYAVKVTPEQPRTLQGSTVRANIEARYYFGEPVPGAKVSYVVHRSRYWPPYYFEEGEEDENAETDDEYLGNEQILEQTGTLDADGKLSIEFPAESAKNDIRYRIEARVTDQANREVSGTGFVLATRAAFYLHAAPEKYVYAAGELAKIRVETRDYDGKYVPDIDFEVQLLLHRGNAVVSTAKGRTGANGIGTVDVRVTSGFLIARVSAKTSDGREVDDDAYLWISGGDASSYERQQRIEIVPDKKSYGRGDIAKVLLVTGMPNASIWVTAETTGILFNQVVESRGPTASIEIPIQSEYAPNIFVTASFVRDGQLFMGTKSLRVPPVEQSLNVAVKSSKPQYKPGERGALTVEAKDFAGKPVSAEFSVGVVDEAIYAIRREAAQDIVNFFYGRRYNSVFTTSSINYAFHGASGKRRMQLAQVNTQRRAQLKPETFVDPRVRKAFPDTVFWSAAVRTGADGRAEVPITFPDSLTTWRTTVRGITADTRVGSAVERTIVRKNLILRVAAPRFFMQGDEVTVSAIVQNYLSSEKTVRVSMEMQGVELLEGSTRDITVASRGSATVDYRVRASNPGTAIFTAKALTDEESDAMELTLPVKPYGVKLSESRTGSVPGEGGQADAVLTFPPDANPASRTMEITISPSVAGTLFGALEYLTSFPYGCTEQTMSSFLPNVIVSRAAKELGMQTGIDEGELTKKIRAGLERLYDYQHEDGGWGWWKSDDSELFMTAYVVSGLARARAVGYSVKPDAIDKGAAWLKTQLPPGKTIDADLRAYIVHALSEAGKPDSELMESVWNDRSRLSPYGLAFLGLAVRTVRSDRADTIAADLERQARSSEQEVWWQVDSDPLLGIGWNASPEATAHTMHFLAMQRPASPLLPKAAVYLVNHRNEGNYWSSTKQTAMVIYGLTGYLKATRELQPDFTATVYVNGNVVATKRVSAADALSPATSVRVTGAQVNAGGNNVRLTKSGKGMLYWSARADYFSTSDRIVRAGSGSLGIMREFHKLVPEKRNDKIVYRLDPLGATVDRGDLIAVRLRITGTQWKYLLIEDPIPAGTEFVTRDDLYELDKKPDWWSRWSTRREFHDDRVAMFDNWFSRGDSEYSYILKVVNPGKYRLPPARVEPMYQPNVFATSDSRSLEVR